MIILFKENVIQVLLIYGLSKNIIILFYFRQNVIE